MTFINILIVAICKSRQAFRAYRRGNMLLQAVKLPISHNDVVGENTVLQLNIFGDWCSHTRGSEFISNSTSSRGSEFISNSTSSRWRWILNHSCENTSLQNVSVENLQFSPTRDWEQHSRESVLKKLLLGWEQECSHIRVWEHPGAFWLVNQLYRPIRNVF